MAITQVGIPFINKNKLNLFLNYTIVEVGDVINSVSESDAYSIIRALEKSKENKLPVLLFSNNQDYIYILSYSEGYGVYQVNGIGSFQDANRVIYYRYTLGTDPSGAFHHEVKTYDLLTSENAKKYAKLDSSNSFNNLQTFSEVKVNSYLDINYPDIDIIRISENANGQLQFDFSRVGGGTTVLPSGSANNTATIITTDNIAANVTNKLDKVTTTTPYNQVYAKTTTGAQTMQNMASSALAYSLVYRDEGGKSQIATPTDSDNVKTIANVEYVKNKLANKLDKVTSQGGYRVYAISGAGSQGTVDYSPSSTGSTIMSRDAQGKAQVATPTASDSVKSIANVEYVKNNSSKLTVTDNEDGTLTLSF